MSKKGLLFINEIIWIIVILIISTLILYPIIQKIPDFSFLIINFVFIFITFFLMRYIVFLSSSIISKKRMLLKVLFFLSIPFIFILTDRFYTVLAFFKEYGLTFIPDDFSYEDAKSLANYVKTEILFFGIASIITSVIFPFRILTYLWKTSNSDRK